MKNSILKSAILAVSLSAPMAQAAPVLWTDWTASDLASASGSMGSVGVSFTGSLQFAQLANGTMIGSGANASANYWTEGSPAPYTGNAVVDNAPTAHELLAFNGFSTNKITFDQAVIDPIMAIVSQGQPGVPVTYDFDQSFTVLSEGQGYWGDGTYTLGVGDQLIGRELHGVIQFQGSFTELSWTSTQENWHGFTIGMVEPQTSVSEPAALSLLGLGLLGLAAARRRKA
jgi:hypothetical protein